MLDRLNRTIIELTVNTAAATTEEINYGPYAGGEVFILTTEAASVTTLTWYAAPVPGGTYYPAQDSDGNAITQTVSHTKSYPIPTELYGCRAIKPVANAAGVISVSLKG